jgi:N-methylhydantoinase A
MRYSGQGHEIAVDLPVADYEAGDASVFRDAFDAEYRRLYGRTTAQIDIEVLSWTLTVSAPARQLPGDPGDCERQAAPPADDKQSCFDPVQERRADISVYSRRSLAPGIAIAGPALITEDQTTTVVTSAFDAHIDASGNIVLSRRGDA